MLILGKVLFKFLGWLGECELAAEEVKEGQRGPLCVFELRVKYDPQGDVSVMYAGWVACVVCRVSYYRHPLRQELLEKDFSECLVESSLNTIWRFSL